MKKKILFIQSTPYDHNHNLVKKGKLYFVGLTFPLLAALTPEHWDVEICLETIENVPFDTDAAVIGISGMGHAIIRSIDLAKEFTKRGKIVVIGGYMASLMPEEAKKYCDAVVIGDAENVWPEVLSDIENNCLKPFYKKEISSLDTPLPKYELIINKNIGDFLPVQAGRGCPHSCSFCSVSCLYKNKYYQRNIEDVIRDLKYIKQLGFKKFLLLDDNIVSNPKYMFELCEEIQRLDMKWLSQCSINIAKNDKLLSKVAQSGCVALSFGLESISQKSLESMDKAWEKPEEYSILLKKVLDAGIDLSTEMVVGADGDSKDSIRATAKFIEDNNIVVPRFYILTPIPGTKFFDEMSRQGRIDNTDIFTYNGSEAVHVPLNMTPEELTTEYWKLYNAVFRVKSIIKRTFMNKNFFRRPMVYIFYFFINLYYKRQIKQRITPNII
jgi:radical SAM superfamily enzyme YgiQ (UPF0313 family)